MSTQKETPSGRARRDRLSLPPLDLNQRYSIDEAALYLRQSVAQTYVDLASGKLHAFKDGRRTYVSGSAIAARNSGAPWKPQRPSPQAA
jgi:hypothetical protein